MAAFCLTGVQTCRSEEHTSELQSRRDLVCRLLLEKTITRTTNGANGNSGPATKRWSNARILITPNATNICGQPHTFIFFLKKGRPPGSPLFPFPGLFV